MRHLRTYEVSHHDHTKADQVVNDLWEIFFKKSPRSGEYNVGYIYDVKYGEYQFFVEIDYMDEELLNPIREMCDWLTVDWYLEGFISQGRLGDEPTIRQYFTSTDRKAQGNITELDSVLKSLDVFKQSDKYNL